MSAEAKKDDDAIFELLNTKTSDELDDMLMNVLNAIPHEAISRDIGTTAERRRQGLSRRFDLFGGIKDYFVNYWHNLKLIFSGNFSEGIFNQLKNSGSWCEKDNAIVKAIKDGIAKLSGGALDEICDCLYPIVKNSDDFKNLGTTVLKGGSASKSLLKDCSATLGKRIKGAIKKNGKF
ncbi:hypothetical protein EC968_001556 [Mortierella alpina]|nr:hypothetical protein EC968_001556 [Mortierella alpina]